MIRNVKPQNEIFQKLFAALPNAGERRCKYVLTEPCDEGLLLWNTLTLALHLWEGGSAEDWEQERFSADDRREMARHWLLVPEGFDEAKTVEQLRSLLRAKEGMPTKYTILTTTACNARCPYCYQRHGRFAKATMSEQVARNTVDFILRTNRAEKIQLDWIGGEPLLNTSSINIICQGLREKGIEFRSFITTNGILFDKQIISRAKDDWNVFALQITIDGREKEYNRVKNYSKTVGDNPFQRIIQNIHLLCDADFKPSIRLNLSHENYEELDRLADFLLEEFGDKVKLYCALLDEEKKLNDAELLRLNSANQRRLKDKLKRITDKGKMTPAWPWYKCIADNENCHVISPLGDLFRCQDIRDEDICGNIYQGITRPENVGKFKQKITGPYCDECPVRPTCHKLALCAACAECTEVSYPIMLEEHRQSMLAKYRRWRENQTNNYHAEKH